MSQVESSFQTSCLTVFLQTGSGASMKQEWIIESQLHRTGAGLKLDEVELRLNPWHRVRLNQVLATNESFHWALLRRWTRVNMRALWELKPSQKVSVVKYMLLISSAASSCLLLTNRQEFDDNIMLWTDFAYASKAKDGIHLILLHLIPHKCFM